MNLALFDFDGTITTGDTFVPFLRFAVRPRRIVLGTILAPWCEMTGVDLICTELEERGGRLTGRYRYGDCSGASKAERIRERYDLSQYAVVYAYGDSAEDQDLLALAHRKYFRWVEIGQA